MIIWFLKKLVTVVRQSIFLSFLLIISIGLSIFIYSIFYNWYLPKAKFERNVLFQLFDLSNKNYQGGPVLVGEADLFTGSDIDKFHFGQDYTISLVLDLPESDLNFDIGLFGITIEAFDTEGRKSLSQKSMVKNMGTMHYKSKLLRWLLTLFYFPSYLLGRFEQKQTLNIVLKENFVDNPYLPARKFVISIHQRIQFYSVKFIVEANFSGLKFFLYHWYYSTTVLLCFLIMLVIFCIFLTTFYDVKSFLFHSKEEKVLNENQLVPIKAVGESDTKKSNLNELTSLDDFSDKMKDFEYPENSTKSSSFFSAKKWL